MSERTDDGGTGATEWHPTEDTDTFWERRTNLLYGSKSDGVFMPDHPALPQVSEWLQQQANTHPRAEVTATVWRVEVAEAAADWLEKMATLVEDDGFEEFAPDVIASWIRHQIAENAWFAV